jgi:hypothetical protein
MRRTFGILICFLMLTGLASAQESLGYGRLDLPLIAGQQFEAGIVTIHNNNGGLFIGVTTDNGWQMVELQIHAGWAENPVPTKKGNPVPGQFDFKYEFPARALSQSVFLDFNEDLQGFRWGEPYELQRTRHIAVHADLVQVDGGGNVIAEEGAWARGNNEFDGSQWGWWATYEMTHKARGHFIDSPVDGLQFLSPTENAWTDESGGFFYFPGEHGIFYLGSQYLGTTVLDHKNSPLDLFSMSDIEDPRVANMAKLLQSLDADAAPKQGITITPETRACFEQALTTHGHVTDWSVDGHIDALVQTTIANCPGLVEVDREDAVANLDRSVNPSMFRKNVSRTPERASAKAKLNIMRAWFPAVKANGETAVFLDDSEQLVEGVPYYDENGELLRIATEAKPIVVTYTDRDENTDAHDVWASISRDDGHTFKRKNISRAAYRSSFDVDGVPFYGHAKKPVFQVQGNKILVAWTSKYCRGGKPAYSIDVCPDDDGDGVPDPCIVCKGNPDAPTCELDYIYDDPFWTDDIWGVAGPQRSHDYTEDGYPEVGVVPYSCVWTVRGVIASQADINRGVFDPLMYVDDMGTPDDPTDDTERGVVEGDIVWYKPERLTSGRRDANQVFMGGAEGAGFAIAWQEDPGGLRPGEAKGPGPGWGGATTNHKTDIWYSFIKWSDFDTIDANFVPGGDPEHDDPNFVGRPKALVPMSLPVRISDNDVVNTDNMWIELDPTTGLPVQNSDGSYNPVPNPDTQSIEESYGSHRYGYMLDGLWNWDGSSIFSENDPLPLAGTPGSGALYEFTNYQDEVKRVVVTADGRPLDGNTGASRPNLFLKTYPKPDGSKSAWAIMAYEETKGMGSGPPEDNGDGTQPQDGSGYDPYAMVPDEGKNAIYHSFDFTQPDLVSAGTILNLPETDEDGNPVFVVEPDYLGSDPIYDGEGNIVGYDPIPNPLAGQSILDWKGDLQLAYENARRPRFILQSKSGAFGGTKPDGTFKEPLNSGTVLIVLYKEGEEGHGRPSDIMARRCLVKDADGNIKKGNPYAPSNFLPGVQNVSTVHPIETWVNPDRDPDAKGDGTKVCRWDQPVEALGWKSSENPYEDARAHRGQIRGDFVIMGYSYTPNWAASRKAHDKYDFYLRRSFDGGATWTTDPQSTEDVVHTDIFFDPEGISGAELDAEGNDTSEPTKHYYVETSYPGGGQYEPARNVSLLKNNKASVIEPRIVAVPGTIKVNSEWTGIPEDKANTDVFYVAYGTSTNLPEVEKAPEDLFLSCSTDRGSTLEMDEWVVNPDSDGNWAGETKTGWYRLAKGDAEQGEVQLRMTPDGSRFYASWLEEGEEGSDIVFRRLMLPAFEVNVADPSTTTP